MDRLEYISPGGEIEISLPALIRKKAVAVYKDGVGFSPLIFNSVSSPTQKEVIINADQYAFADELQPGENVTVLYQNTELILVTTLIYNVYTGNTLDAPTDETFNAPFKIDNIHLSYEPQLEAIAFEIIAPLKDVDPGGDLPYIYSGFTYISHNYDAVDNSWHIFGTVPGNRVNNITITLPAYVSVFNMNGVRMTNWTDTIFQEGVYYWEDQNFNNPGYNYGYGYRRCTTCRIRFDKLPVISGIFEDDYNFPADLEVLSHVTVGSFYVVELAFSGLSNHIFNLTSNP